VTDLPLLSRLLREAFSGDPWHGASLRDLLVDVSAELAAARPIPGAHSIWEIALHCDAWLRILRLRLLGSPDETPPAAIAYPPVTDASAAAWQAAIERLEEAERRLREMVLQQPGARFDPSSREYDGRMHGQLLGGIAHLAYHGGQVTMLRRAMGLGASSLPG
jgi:uncharacterized damage-inducible protein DinB